MAGRDSELTMPTASKTCCHEAEQVHSTGREAAGSMQPPAMHAHWLTCPQLDGAAGGVQQGQGQIAVAPPATAQGEGPQRRIAPLAVGRTRVVAHCRIPACSAGGSSPGAARVARSLLPRRTAVHFKHPGGLVTSSTLPNTSSSPGLRLLADAPPIVQRRLSCEQGLQTHRCEGGAAQGFSATCLAYRRLAAAAPPQCHGSRPSTLARAAPRPRHCLCCHLQASRPVG